MLRSAYGNISYRACSIFLVSLNSLVSFITDWTDVRFFQLITIYFYNPFLHPGFEMVGNEAAENNSLLKPELTLWWIHERVNWWCKKISYAMPALLYTFSRICMLSMVLSIRNGGLHIFEVFIFLSRFTNYCCFFVPQYCYNLLVWSEISRRWEFPLKLFFAFSVRIINSLVSKLTVLKQDRKSFK